MIVNDQRRAQEKRAFWALQPNRIEMEHACVSFVRDQPVFPCSHAVFILRHAEWHFNHLTLCDGSLLLIAIAVALMLVRTEGGR